jgi:hypothetical protein
MSTPKKTKYDAVNASPVKSFFVSMLTRDIKLEEAILDLLDNCVDGILRQRISSRKPKPYEGFRAAIKYDKDSFMISDNCGGIPWELHDYAFRMGRAKDRPPDKPGTVGVYGIGMKRAIFKMGRQCLISTQNGDNLYDVTISPEWIENEEEWNIPVFSGKKSMKEDGTTILIGDLYSGIATRFHDDAMSFTAEMGRMVGTHYAFIIGKGFEVTINGKSIKPRPMRLLFGEKPLDKKAHVIRPYVFKQRTEDGVDVFLAVGLKGPVPSQDDIAQEQEEKRYSSTEAGWTILCNDRAVLYCDRSELTGWGEAGIPRYHTQFIEISGIVEFRCADASKLPTTTTKRGIDASSPLYLQIKNKMREGMRIFTDYTNKWKGRAEESEKYTGAADFLTFDEIKEKTKSLVFTETRDGRQLKPSLPIPKKLESRKRRISFVKDAADVKAVSLFLFNESDQDPSKVGEACFDRMLEDSK